MTNPTLTQAEINAMEKRNESFPKGLIFGVWDNNDKHQELIDFINEANTFIPKSIAALREKDRAFSELMKAADDLSDYLQELQVEIATLKEQTHWRHIDQEKPEDGQWCCIHVCGKPEPVRTKSDSEYWNGIAQEVFNKQLFPYWQPLPPKGPELNTCNAQSFKDVNNQD